VESTAAERAAAGIPEGLIRYSVGIEDVEDLKKDLDDALNAGL
jgi:cystathionine gamma-synthase